MDAKKVEQILRTVLGVKITAREGLSDALWHSQSSELVLAKQLNPDVGTFLAFHVVGGRVGRVGASAEEVYQAAREICAVEGDAADFAKFGFSVDSGLGTVLRGAGVPTFANEGPGFLEEINLSPDYFFVE